MNNRRKLSINGGTLSEVIILFQDALSTCFNGSMQQLLAMALLMSTALGAGAVSFTNEIAPILVQKCLTCHGAEKSKGGYRVDTFEGVMKAGSSKEAPVVAGKPKESYLYRLLVTTDEDDRMPQKNEPLPAAEIQQIERWIEDGAKFDGGDPTVALTSMIPPIHQPEPPAAYPAPIAVTALAFSPNALEIAVGGYHEITIWTANEGKLLRRIKNVAQSTLGLAYHETLLAAASGTPGKMGEVKLFDSTSGRLEKVLVTSADVMVAVAFSPDGKKLAAGGSDNKIRIYEVETGKLERTIEQHSDWVTDLKFSHSGNMLASASRDKSARIFDVKTGEMEHSFLGHGDFVFGVAFSLDDKHAWSAGRDRKTQWWRTNEDKKEGEISGFEGDALKVLVTSNAVFSCSADGLVRQHTIGKKPELIRSFGKQSGAVYVMALDEKNGRLATGAFDGKVRIWDVGDGKEVLSFTAAPGWVEAR